ncbi:MAG TPA: hypothetical protein VIO14_03535 [Dehalococcoidia bacterium]
MTVKEELHRLVDQLPDPEAEDALEYLRWLLSEEEVLTPEEMDRVKAGEAELARGDSTTLDDLKRRLGA